MEIQLGDSSPAAASDKAALVAWHILSRVLRMLICAWMFMPIKLAKFC